MDYLRTVGTALLLPGTTALFENNCGDWKNLSRAILIPTIFSGSIALMGAIQKATDVCTV